MTICLTLVGLTPQISASDRGRSGSEQRDRSGSRNSGNRPSRGNTNSGSNSNRGNTDNRRSNGGDRNNSNKNNGGNYRPDNGNHNGGSGNHGGNNSGNYRPDNGNHNGNHNGGNSGNNGGNYRPGNGRHDNHGGNHSGNHNGNYRPDNGRHDNHGGNHNHGGYRPQPGYHGPHYGHVCRPSHRPYRPAPCPYHRPTPPAYYRPHCHITPLQAILGVTLGAIFDTTVDIFIGRNYYIDGYSDNYLYMCDVNAYNYLWPDVMLYYNNGYLTSSQFSYSTNYFDGSRYNNVYNQLYGVYGAPAIAQNIANGRRVTWWGYDNQYITLEFQSTYTNGYGTRYYTNIIIGR